MSLCVRSTALPGSGVVDTTCAFVIVEHYEIREFMVIHTRLRKQTMDPGFAQDNPGFAQIHALHARNIYTISYTK